MSLLSNLNPFSKLKAKREEKERLEKAYGENYFVKLRKKGNLKIKKEIAWVVSCQLPGYEAVLIPNFKYD